MYNADAKQMTYIELRLWNGLRVIHPTNSKLCFHFFTDFPLMKQHEALTSSFSGVLHFSSPRPSHRCRTIRNMQSGPFLKHSTQSGYNWVKGNPLNTP